MSLFSMSKLLIKSLFRGPSTGKYPNEPKVNYSKTRGKIDIEISECIFCGMCQRRCPANAIEVDREQTKWTIDRFRCVQCGYCVEVCPKKCLSMNTQYAAPASEKSKDVFTRA